MPHLRAWLILLTVPALCVALFLLSAPPRHNPFAPVDLTDRPGLGTGHQLARAARHPQVCFPALDKAGVLYTPLDDAPKGEKCGLYNALTLDRTLTPYSATLRMTCGEAAALYVWERHVARPAAVDILGSPIARIETYGSFACRNIARSNRRSQHASANALDLAGFRLEDGTRITVARDWNGDDDKAHFLRDVKAAACNVFKITLSPEYNAAHHDHFHVDMGGFGMCR